MFIDNESRINDELMYLNAINISGVKVTMKLDLINYHYKPPQFFKQVKILFDFLV